MTALDFMDRPIAFHRVFVTITGSVNAALMLSQAIYWSRRSTREGWFYKSAVDWEKETGLTRHEQLTARKLLTEVLEEKLAGMPATTHFRVTSEQLRKWLGNNSSASSPESGQQDGDNSDNKSAGSRQSTNRSETTSESTSKRTATINRGAGDRNGDVDNIYNAYPKKVGKPAALKAIRAALKRFGKQGRMIKTLLELTQEYAKTVEGADMQFIPNPSTWFNQERYNDNPLTWKPHGAKTAKTSGRGHGTANEGRSSQYRGVGGVR